MMTRDEVARELISYHVLVEQEIISAFHYVREGGDSPGEPVKLLEVSRATVPAGIAPIYFGPTKDIPYPVVIIEVTEEEFREVESGQLPLPPGWEQRVELHQRAA
jgi:hypothetical protein